MFRNARLKYAETKGRAAGMRQDIEQGGTAQAVEVARALLAQGIAPPNNPSIAWRKRGHSKTGPNTPTNPQSSI